MSIILPVYNTKKFLPTCLDSLCAQTLTNIEVLIIDDHSSEDIAGTVQSYLNDQRFHYYRLPANLGPGGARNVGLELAQGKYIGFCDSDDWYDLNYCEQGVLYMDQIEAEIGMYSLVREAPAKNNEKLYKCKYDQMIQLTPDLAFKIMTYQLDVGIKVIPPCTNKIYRSEFLKNLNVKFEEHMYFQDVYFTFQTMLKSKKIVCIPKVCYHHYRRPQSIIQSFSQKHIDDFCRLFTLLKIFLKNEELYEKYCLNYYKLCEHFYNIIIRQIFEFIRSEDERKKYIRSSFGALREVVNWDEYLEYASAEELRRHLQPHITDTTLY